MVSSSRVDTVLVGNDFPELKIIKEREKLKIKSFSREIKTKDWGGIERIDDETKLQTLAGIYKNPLLDP